MTLTSFRRFTVYPGGNVPALSMRIGHRLQRDFETQHFFLGCFLDLAGTGASVHKRG